MVVLFLNKKTLTVLQIGDIFKVKFLEAAWQLRQHLAPYALWKRTSNEHKNYITCIFVASRGAVFISLVLSHYAQLLPRLPWVLSVITRETFSER